MASGLRLVSKWGPKTKYPVGNPLVGDSALRAVENSRGGAGDGGESGVQSGLVHHVRAVRSSGMGICDLDCSPSRRTRRMCMRWGVPGGTRFSFTLAGILLSQRSSIGAAFAALAGKTGMWVLSGLSQGVVWTRTRARRVWRGTWDDDPEVGSAIAIAQRTLQAAQGLPNRTPRRPRPRSARAKG